MPRKRRKRRLRKFFLLAALALLIAGFMARRALVPALWHYLTHRPARSVAEPDAPSESAPEPGAMPEAAAPEASTSPQAVAGAQDNWAPPPAAASKASPAATAAQRGEKLSERDRQELDAVLKRKMR